MRVRNGITGNFLINRGPSGGITGMEAHPGSRFGPTRRISFQRLSILVLVIISFASSAYGRDFMVKRIVEGYSMTIAINQNPPILGKNDLRIEIKDSLGKNVIDVPVTVNYFMPPMPGMAPMNYTVKAAPRSSGYAVTMDLIMRGPWNIVTRALVGGKLIRMTVLIDVR